VLLQGTIVDPSGSPIPGATVELVARGKTVVTTVAAADGGFKFADLAAGSYEITVSLVGFRRTHATVIVGATVPRPLRLTLLVGSVSETVEVTSGATAISGGVVGGVSEGVVGGVSGGVVGGVSGAIVGGAPNAAPPPRAMPGFAGAGGGRGGYAGGAVAIRGALPSVADAETYGAIDENKFRRVTDQPLSTFSIDVDTASYANVRRILNEGRLPPIDAVRVEELINYFHFDYAHQTQGAPFGITTELAPCPWNSRHKLALIGLQARRLPAGKIPPRNLVFLLDVSGSMAPANRLPMVKTAMKMLAETLTAEDRVAIVTYTMPARPA
jgi:Ca-activated chloride channel family protein